MSKHISKELSHLQKCEGVSLITMPRAGSEYLQSLLDGHPEILVFILNIQFFSVYLRNSESAADGIIKIEPVNFIYEFVGKELRRFKGIYNKAERLDQLGKNGNQVLDIDLQEFICHFLSILGNEETTIKNIFLSIFGAYHLSVGRDIFRTNIIFHHAHYYGEALLFEEVFPEAKMICCIRDPRASIKSMVYNFKKNVPEHYNYYMYFNSLKVIDEISNEVFTKCQSSRVSKCLFVKLENMPREDELEKILDFIGVSFSPSVLVSTWAGLEWGGDKASGKAFNPTEKWSIDRSYNNWKEELSTIDKIQLESAFQKFLNDFGYDTVSRNAFQVFINKIVSFFFLMKPLSLEYGFFSRSYIFGKFKKNGRNGIMGFISTIYYYFRIRALFINLLLK
ncbi:MAG: sulfotransferase [Gammaproteobacteria bacterium]|nr:sulfotransferase [Gammaproteobacteria bacterium]